MSGRRHTRSSPAPLPAASEQSGSGEVQELREQVTAMMGAMQRQETRMEQFHLLLEQQAAAAATAAESRNPPAPSTRVPGAVEGEGVRAVPLTECPLPRSTPLAASGSATPDTAAEEAERERALAVLMRFLKFKPRTFEGAKVEPAVVESWFDAMESIFGDISALERDKVPLATHCLGDPALVWWKRVKRDRPAHLPPMAWEEFKKAVYGHYFPDADKRVMKEKFRKLRQGNRSVLEYEQEFSHIIDCVPDVVRDDADRADWFLRGLKPWIYRAVQLFKLTTYAEVLDRALWAEHGDAHVREERELAAESKDKGKKRQGGGSGAQSSSKRPPKQPRPQPWRQGPRPCVICGSKNHRVSQCDRREGRCFSCGQDGHISRECPAKGSHAPSAASTPAAPVHS